ncbi:phosphopantothenoylcysteine decarboxylase [Candidatus Kinetoplastibacterium desouzaii TCC079E]|uniref:Coenzyme A biosynthesis bifunctional protein CoaBC n=1 Tax=Candidatus Kinetoplastidibacterium desouzai TCC079E TaxID=1208919 RepID=M1M3G8_9PROT|nr:bifunctional phosphopantothenoylcysteine decarboxylase/phosphopantothenate--cysteine ligase CoaBC [Candidatus Kinetoplastibacterium desouzaii]AGF46785.1 phosphopantothenoylcysteine decarboxylase [Candidatus Kinetoplastibacterium desouzaii TCC079E]
MSDLYKKNIIIGMTGSIACYKVADLIKILIEKEAIVTIVMTKSSKNFITKTTMETLSGKDVIDDESWNISDNGINHINLTRKADLIIIVPSTANFIAKISNGIADDFLSTMCLARNCQLFIAPAMNKEMWNNPSTQRNIKQLILDNIKIIGPSYGKQACGEIGYGKLAEIEEISDEIISFFQPKLLKNKKILITAGPTIEPIDPIRFISNKSSGKMGYSIAKAAYEFGADVTLVTGPTNLKIPTNIKTYNVVTAVDMYQSVMRNIADIDVFISVAAVSDWKVLNYQNNKIKKNNTNNIPKIILDYNPDILYEVAKIKNKPFCVGFAAETENLKDYAYKKLIQKNIDLIIANIATDVMNSDKAKLMLIDSSEILDLPNSNKIEAARQVMKEISKKLKQ